MQAWKPALSSKILPLGHLKPGQQATIVRIGGCNYRRRRYMEMGFVRGEHVAVKRVAPLGDPIEYEVKGYRLSLRRNDADQILVEIDDGTTYG